jgi:uncharacterized protein (DUF362 family)
MKIPPRPKVILRHCDTYDPGKIRVIVREAMEELGLSPRGRALIKPNCVASKPQFPHAYTRPELLEGVIMALRDRVVEPLEELAVGERCGITVPTRFAFEGADYYPMFKRTGVKHYHFEEVPQVEIPLSHEGRLRDYVFTPEPVANADFFVNMPEVQVAPLDDRHVLDARTTSASKTTVTASSTTITGSTRRSADLQYIIQPQLIVIDAIDRRRGAHAHPKAASTSTW